jgi:hypothetical protein
MEFWNLQVIPGLVKGHYSVNFSLESPIFRGYFGFIERDGIVQVANFNAGDITQAPFYDVKNVLRVLGVPAYIGVDLGSVNLTAPKISSLSILIYYQVACEKLWPEKPWALVGYSGGAIKIGDGYRFCPTDLRLKTIASPQQTEWLPWGFGLELQSPQSPMTQEELGRDSTLPEFEELMPFSLLDLVE